ncbi:hypothetical protein B0H16DRAFT_1477908 [Mycena metata]|uniref:Uncharacterized protein n=1 Tax=Mycena metata TaxID=1033252 RepID=A0AAD7H7W2_9AGAR|nr:hypothetical protein B0H16DRAFT_1477908 [Mycena metata]
MSFVAIVLSFVVHVHATVSATAPIPFPCAAYQPGTEHGVTHSHPRFMAVGVLSLMFVVSAHALRRASDSIPVSRGKKNAILPGSSTHIGQKKLSYPYSIRLRGELNPHLRALDDASETGRSPLIFEDLFYILSPSPLWRAFSILELGIPGSCFTPPQFLLGVVRFNPEHKILAGLPRTADEKINLLRVRLRKESNPHLPAINYESTKANGTITIDPRRLVLVHFFGSIRDSEFKLNEYPHTKLSQLMEIEANGAAALLAPTVLGWLFLAGKISLRYRPPEQKYAGMGTHPQRESNPHLPASNSEANGTIPLVPEDWFSYFFD